MTPQLHERSMAFLNRIRLRVVVFVIGIPLAAFGAISLGPAWMALPLFGVAVAAMTMTVNKATQRLGQHACLTCGHELGALPAHDNGIICPSCGALNQHKPPLLAMLPAEDDPSQEADDGDDRQTA